MRAAAGATAPCTAGQPPRVQLFLEPPELAIATPLHRRCEHGKRESANIAKTAQAKQEAVGRMLRQDDPAYGGDVSSKREGDSGLCAGAVEEQVLVRRAAGCWPLPTHSSELMPHTACQEETARSELFASAAAIKAARRVPKATDIGFGLPGQGAERQGERQHGQEWNSMRC